ncbi:hypothetical protein RUM44_005442 [Polyplax serrata]|uniref:MYND-type domain-containing protein n=1 Tax=Polyplax serrata TaxID=468196 RepID=A0ABR1AW62_POLSC
MADSKVGIKMNELPDNILQAGEVETYVQSLQPSKIEDLGTPLWFESHHRLQKLNQQATIEASEMREEIVKELLISNGKIPILIHEAICIQVWREKIFSQILKLQQEPQNTFIAYIILFHEITAVSLLTNILYHKDSLQGAEDTVVDLIDYCSIEVVRLLSGDYIKIQESTTNVNNMEDLKSQCKTIGFNIGLSAVCILRYLTEFLDNLPLTAVARLYKTHDVPLLMTTLLQMAPWKRVNPKTNVTQIYEDRMWKNIEKIPGISKYEGQCWIALKTLLLDMRSENQYEVNDFRKQHFLKIQTLLTETIIDQLPPLLGLKQFLSHLAVRDVSTLNKAPLIMETIPEIKSNIMKKCFKKWKSITKKQVEMIFCCKKDILMDVARRLGETYDIDHIEKLFPEGPFCAACGDSASKRCSKCRNEWYCGRECQVKRWPKHKLVCELMANKEEGDT